MESHVIGFPRIGPNRELKTALESFWAGDIDEPALLRRCDEIKTRNWQTQRNAGLTYVTTGDFSMYDHVLDTAVMLGLTPRRFDDLEAGSLTRHFAMARGNPELAAAPLEMTKWFDTNYHYLVPELDAQSAVGRGPAAVVTETAAAHGLGFRTKAVLLGPVTFLSLATEEGIDRWSLLDDAIEVYRQVIEELASHCEWVQIDEPILACDLSPAQVSAYRNLGQRLRGSSRQKLLLATYFGPLQENLATAIAAGFDGIHLDLVRGRTDLPAVLDSLPADQTLSLGLVDGRNIWRSDLDAEREVLKETERRLGSDRIMVASSCSLQHVPVDVEGESSIAPSMRSWLAFATQKCAEVAALGGSSDGEPELFAENRRALKNRASDPRVRVPQVRNRVASITPEMRRRHSDYPARAEAQARALNLPPLPTTTIGSFPQTRQIRRARAEHRAGKLTDEQYLEFLRDEVRSVVALQEELGLDVLVHGEPERNDMVEYFGEQLDGMITTSGGWVQSYGSRCVKPPIIYGDVARRGPMTVDWSVFAQSLTQRPMKAMLTGPVTILCWSFVRDDLPRDEVCRQIALAVRDEVADLEAAGLRVIQIDEAAFREGLPLRRSDWAAYFDWAVDCFRLSSSVVSDATQIHLHMCYSEFESVVQPIIDLDADVLSIESARSKMRLLDVFRHQAYPSGIGPGVYDIHMARASTTDEIASLIDAALEVIPAHQLWVNPDCGLKTRNLRETKESLAAMVNAAKAARTSLSAAR